MKVLQSKVFAFLVLCSLTFDCNAEPSLEPEQLREAWSKVQSIGEEIPDDQVGELIEKLKVPRNYRKWLERGADSGNLDFDLSAAFILNLPHVDEGHDVYTLSFYHFKEWKKLSVMFCELLLQQSESEFLKHLSQPEEENFGIYSSLAALGLEDELIAVAKRSLSLIEKDSPEFTNLMHQIVRSIDRNSLVDWDSSPSFPDALNFERRKKVFEELSLGGFLGREYTKSRRAFVEEPTYMGGPENYEASLYYNMGELEKADALILEHIKTTMNAVGSRFTADEVFEANARQYVPAAAYDSDVYRRIQSRREKEESRFEMGRSEFDENPGLSGVAKSELVREQNLEEALSVYRFVSEFRAHLRNDVTDHPVLSSCPQAFAGVEPDKLLEAYNARLGLDAEVPSLEEVMADLAENIPEKSSTPANLLVFDRLANVNQTRTHVNAVREYVESSGKKWREFPWWDYDLPLEFLAAFYRVSETTPRVDHLIIHEPGTDGHLSYHFDFAEICFKLQVLHNSNSAVDLSSHLDVIARITEIDLASDIDSLAPGRLGRTNFSQLTDLAIGAATKLGDLELAARMSYHAKNLIQERQVEFDSALARIGREGGAAGEIVRRFQSIAQNATDLENLSFADRGEFFSVRDTVAHLVSGKISGDETWPDFSVRPNPVIPAGHAVIDFFVGSDLSREKGMVGKLFAAIYRKGEPVKIVYLADTDRLYELTRSYRKILLNFEPVEVIEQEFRDLFLPVFKDLDEVKNLTVSPIDVINFLPIERFALPAYRGGIRFQVSLRKGVLQDETVGGAGGNPLLVGGPLFSNASPLVRIVEEEGKGSLDRRRGVPFTLPALTPLPGTLLEVDNIRKVFLKHGTDADILTMEAATEDSFLDSCADRSFIHIATHGFQFPKRNDQGIRALEGSILAFSGAETTRGLWRRGIFPRADEDGFLNAIELAGADLSGCELVVLSACDTALGESSGFSAVQGIPLAFSAAGVRRAIVTRWPVDDTYAGQFMMRFYEKLLSNDGQTIESLWDTHREEEMQNFSSESRKALYVAPFCLLRLN